MILDQKVTAWERLTFLTDADDPEEQKLREEFQAELGGSVDDINEAVDWLESKGIDYSRDDILETFENMTPKENDGHSTVEVYSGSPMSCNELLWENAPTRVKDE